MTQLNVLPFKHAQSLNRGNAHLLVRDRSKDLEVVNAFGDLDLASAQELESMLIALSTQDHAPALVADLSACHYLDSTILTVFVRTARRLGNRFGLVIPAESAVRRIFRIVGLDTVIPIDESLDLAAARLHKTMPHP